MVLRVAAAGQPDSAVDHREFPRPVFDANHLAAEQDVAALVSKPVQGHFAVQFHHQSPVDGVNDLPFQLRNPMSSGSSIDANLI
jgi:hypothetical protein